MKSMPELTLSNLFDNTGGTRTAFIEFQYREHRPGFSVTERMAIIYTPKAMPETVEVYFQHNEEPTLFHKMFQLHNSLEIIVELISKEIQTNFCQNLHWSTIQEYIEYTIQNHAMAQFNSRLGFHSPKIYGASGLFPGCITRVTNFPEQAETPGTIWMKSQQIFKSPKHTYGIKTTIRELTEHFSKEEFHNLPFHTLVNTKIKYMAFNFDISSTKFILDEFDETSQMWLVKSDNGMVIPNDQFPMHPDTPIFID